MKTVINKRMETERKGQTEMRKQRDNQTQGKNGAERDTLPIVPSSYSALSITFCVKNAFKVLFKFTEDSH